MGHPRAGARGLRDLAKPLKRPKPSPPNHRQPTWVRGVGEPTGERSSPPCSTTLIDSQARPLRFEHRGRRFSRFVFYIFKFFYLFRVFMAALFMAASGSKSHPPIRMPPCPSLSPSDPPALLEAFLVLGPQQLCLLGVAHHCHEVVCRKQATGGGSRAQLQQRSGPDVYHMRTCRIPVVGAVEPMLRKVRHGAGPGSGKHDMAC